MAKYIRIKDNAYALTAIVASGLLMAMLIIETLNMRTYLDEVIGLLSLGYIAFRILFKAKS